MHVISNWVFTARGMVHTNKLVIKFPLKVDTETVETKTRSGLIAYGTEYC